MRNAFFAVCPKYGEQSGRIWKGFGLSALTALACALTWTAQAEKLDCSGTKRSKQEISNQSIKPGDRSDRELVQFVRVDVLASKHPEFDKTETTVYGHLDNVGPSGIDTGYAAYTLTSGEKLWVKWQGTHYVVTKGNNDWEVPYLGVYHFISGTGKYKAIRGGGFYKGRVTPARGTEEDSTCEAEY
jgi:hypothetical protein